MHPVQAARRRTRFEVASEELVATSNGAQATADVTFYDAAAEPTSQTRVDQDSLLRRTLALGDLVAVLIAFAGTALLLGRSLDLAMLLTALAVVPVNKLLGLYDRDAYVINKTTIDDVPKLLNSAVIMAFVAAGVNDLAHPGHASLSARALAAFVGSTAISLALIRMIGRRLVRAQAPAERCLLVGDANECEDLRRKLSVSPTVKSVVIGRASLEMCAGGGRAIREMISRNHVTRLIVVPYAHNPDEVSDALRAMRSFGAKISVVPPLMEAIGTAVERDQFCGTELIGVRDMRMSRSSIALKRALDVTGAGIGLLVLSPFFLVTAIAIKLDSAGPVFYRQERIGRDGESFWMTKFRTMIADADAQKEALRAQNESVGMFKIQDDPRVTRVGHLLRKTSLDELPQLLNVLRGDMSLVGPRPLVPAEDENISGWYRRRSQIMPGMTGVWQLHGPVRIPLQEMVKVDYVYVASWTIWSDLKILMQTIPHVLARRSL